MSPGPTWNPEQYHKFSDHRLQPARELLDRVRLSSLRTIYDLGCGTGNVTRLLAARWPDARIIGIDGSVEMLEQARSGGGGIEWVHADIHDWTPDEAPDLIFSNAALHWVREHRKVFPRMAGLISRGGCLAVQMPLSRDLPSHRLMREILADCNGRVLGSTGLWKSMERKRVLEASEYQALLSESSDTLEIWETEYQQMLEGEDPVLEWVRGTGLRPILEGLNDEDTEAFLEEYRLRLREAYPPGPDGRTRYPFRRLFIVAHM